MLVLDNRVSATGAIAGAVVGNIGAVHTCYDYKARLPCLYCSLLATCCLLLVPYLLTYYLSTTS